MNKPCMNDRCACYTQEFDTNCGRAMSYKYIDMCSKYTPNKIESAWKKRWNVLKNYPTKNGFESKLRFIMLDWMEIIENMSEDIL